MREIFIGIAATVVIAVCAASGWAPCKPPSRTAIPWPAASAASGANHTPG